MHPIAVAGLMGLETNLRINGFPLPYAPIHYPFHGVRQDFAGVGFNISLALARLGQRVRLATLLGDDDTGAAARRACEQAGIDCTSVHSLPNESSSQTVVLVDASGRRQIHCDLKHLQERALPAGAGEALLDGAALAVLGNINFTRPLLALARQSGVPVVTDVHALSDFDDAYNHDFMTAATVLFLSHEQLPCSPYEATQELRGRFDPQVLVVGLGAEGCLLSERGQAPLRLAAVAPRGVVNTVGAGDALLAAFVDQWQRGASAAQALGHATHYAGWKVGDDGATQGLLLREQWLAHGPGTLR
jgi:acarbose 7IV-phosphotransferase